MNRNDAVEKVVTEDDDAYFDEDSSAKNKPNIVRVLIGNKDEKP